MASESPASGSMTGNTCSPNNSMPSKPDSNATGNDCGGPTAEKLVKMLDLAAAIYGKELTDLEVQLWLGFFRESPSPAIEYAFLEHMREAQWFPKPTEIVAYIRDWKERHQPLYLPAPRPSAEEWESFLRQLEKVSQAMPGRMEKIAAARRVPPCGDIQISEERRQELQRQKVELMARKEMR